MKIALTRASSYQVGQIYQMSVGSRSHVKVPYFVEIVDVGDDYITTSIPGKHELKIDKGNWDYQTSRMTYVGTKEQYGQLLYNQEGLLPE